MSLSRVFNICVKTPNHEQTGCLWYVDFLPESCKKHILRHCRRKLLTQWHILLYACAGSEDQKVYLWDLQTKEIAQTLVGHTGAVLAVSTHPTEMIVASGGMAPDNTVKIWKDLSIIEGTASSSAGNDAAEARKEQDSATSGT